MSLPNLFLQVYKYRIYIYAVLFFEFIIEALYFSTILAKLFISNMYAYALLICLRCLCMPLVGQYHDQYRYRQLRFIEILKQQEEETQSPHDKQVNVGSHDID